MSPAVQSRAQTLFEAQRLALASRTDRLFGGLLVFQWLCGLGVALWRSPLTWEGAASGVHPSVWAALLLGGLIALPAARWALTRSGDPATPFVVAVAQMLYGALFIHLTGGRIETHFHIFGSLAFLAFYRDWRVLVLASAVVAGDHLLRSSLAPASIYGVLAADPWRWVEHASWVVFTDLFLVTSCLQGRAEMHGLARRQAQLEVLNGHMEEEIRGRTADLRKLNEELSLARDVAVEASHTKSSFLANMSHELRTPLNAILGYSEMLQEDVARVAPDLGEDLGQIHKAGKHLLALINDILDISKIEAGKMTLCLEDFQVAPLLSEVESTIQPLVAMHHNTFTLECGPDLGVMKADVTKVRQVLFNLLSNACKFTEAGAVRLRVQRDGDAVAFEVTDSGIGMTPAQQARLFRDFVQADASTTRKYGGTGLGLAISKRFCQMMGGDLTARSEPGRGSTFLARLPCAVVEPPPEAPPQPRPPSLPPSPPQRVPRGTLLVIDDDPVVRDLLGRIGTQEGFRVLTAEGGAQGLLLAAEHKPNAITLDVMMPGMDGWAVLRALKADPQLAQIPVIMLTMLDERAMGRGLGASEYLTKPVGRGTLSDLLRKYWGRPEAGCVLVVDKEPVRGDATCDLLRSAGWTVVRARSGPDALEGLGTCTPDLALVELTPAADEGLAFIQALRQHAHLAALPVVARAPHGVSADALQRLDGPGIHLFCPDDTGQSLLLDQVRGVITACAAPAGRPGSTPTPAPVLTQPHGQAGPVRIAG